ncbi:MAG TPA: 30S ribosomal protein S4e [Candidatus Bathyarchaeia archaeon]
MARKSGSRQLKRAPAPAFWPIHRKEATWAPMTRPGPHPRNKSLPLILVVRENLGYARTAKEATRIVNSSKVKVDLIVRRDHRFPVGLMDVIQIDGVDQVFRVLPKPGRGLSLSPIEARESGYKLCKIVGKRKVRGGRLEINLHDGRNLLSDVKDTQRGEEFEVGGSVQLTLPIQKVAKYVSFQVGSIGLVTDGKNQGLYGKIVAIAAGSYARPKIAKIETEDKAFETPAHYVMPVGIDVPLVALDR